jgi:hypothetical protein
MAERWLVWPVAFTTWFPGSADVGTLKVAANEPIEVVVIVEGTVATWLASKSTRIVSLAPNPIPLTLTLVVGGPTLGFRVILVVTAATG